MSESSTGNPDCNQPNIAKSAQLPTLTVGLGVFVLVLAFYLALAAPTITRGGDCGELVAASWNLGLAHPSGYPLYLVTAKAFATLVPWGEVGWRYNAFSALCAAAAAAITFALVNRVLGSQSPRLRLVSALGSALLPAATTVIVSQATIAEVYAPNQLMLAALLHSAYCWYQGGDWRWLYTLALVTGLALALHLSAVFLLPGIFVLVARGWKNAQLQPAAPGLPLARLLLALACLAAGLSVLTYLPLRASVFPPAPRAFPLDVYFHWPLDWGHPVAWQNFKAHTTAQLYRNLLVAPEPAALGPVHLPSPAKPWGEWGQAFIDWTQTIAFQYCWFFPVALLGAIVAFRDRALGWCLTLTVVLNSVQFGYRVNDLPNFFFPIYLVLAVWLGCGLAHLGATAGRLRGRWGWRLQTLGGLLLASTIGLLWCFGLLYGSKAGRTLTRDVALAQAAEVERLGSTSPHSPAQVVMPSDDFLWAFWYAQYVLGQGKNGVTPWGRGLDHVKERGLLPRYVGQLQVHGPVLFCQVEEDVARQFPYVPVGTSGVLWQAARRPLPPAASPVQAPARVKAEMPLAQVQSSPLWKQQEGEPVVLRGVAVPLEISLPAGFLRKSPGEQNSDWQAGTIELLLVPQDGRFPEPPAPDQGTVSEGDTHLVNTVTLLSHQVRPLILPASYRPEQPYSAIVPLQLPEDMPAARCRIWVRLLPQGASGRTPWRRGQMVRLSTY